MKKIWLITILIGLGIINANPQDTLVTIPETAFLQVLIDERIDTDVDSWISYSDVLDSVYFYDWDTLTKEYVLRPYCDCHMGDCRHVGFGRDWTGSKGGRIVFTYDRSGNKITKAGYHWDSIQSNWADAFELNYWYNEMDLLKKDSLITYDMWDGSADEKNTFTYFYDGNGNKTEEIWKFWDVETSELESASGTQWIYNDIGNLIEQIRNFGIPATESWQPGYKEAFFYDEDNNLVESIEYGWSGEEWIPEDGYHKRRIYTYDPDGNMTERISYYWNGKKR